MTLDPLEGNWLRPPAVGDEIALHLMQSGVLHTRAANLAVGGDAATPVAVPVPWFVLAHPAGAVVIDGGVAAACVADPVGHWGQGLVDAWRPELGEAETCLAALRRVGIAPESVRFVLQTHLHMDHTGALATIAELPNARVVVTRREHEFALTQFDDPLSGYLATDIAGDGVDWLLLGDAEADGYDLLGDGTLRLRQTPGHSPGHQSIELTLAQSGQVLLTGDATYTRERWEGETAPPNAVDPEGERHSWERLREIAGRGSASVLFGHDPVLWPGIVARNPVIG